MEEKYRPGDWIIRQGSEGDGMYLIESGTVEILREENGEEIHLADLSEEDFIGEMSLIDQQPRSASVRAKTDCALLHLSRTNFMHMLSKNHTTALKVTFNIARQLTTRLRQTNLKVD